MRQATACYSPWNKRVAYIHVQGSFEKDLDALYKSKGGHKFD